MASSHHLHLLPRPRSFSHAHAIVRSSLFPGDGSLLAGVPPRQWHPVLSECLLLVAGDHLAALEPYGEAIYKIHTMDVVAPPGTRSRQPGPQDQPILDGFDGALAAVVASAPIPPPIVNRRANRGMPPPGCPPG